LECKTRFVGDDRAGAPHFLYRQRRRADARYIARVIVLHVDVADRVRARETLHFADETQPPGLAAELAVGDHLQAQAFLPADNRGDVRIGIAALQHFLRAQQAADVLGAKGRC
jgi:hypothetical protein